MFRIAGGNDAYHSSNDDQEQILLKIDWLDDGQYPHRATAGTNITSGFEDVRGSCDNLFDGMNIARIPAAVQSRDGVGSLELCRARTRYRRSLHALLARANIVAIHGEALLHVSLRIEYDNPPKPQ